uniref:Uncharacterized protein n=1 Tax=Moniliophthora roreri TaxID=221103 RepID=A0A0W0FTC2_MONRR
MQESGVST